MNDQGITRESEFILRRLSEGFPLSAPTTATWLVLTVLGILGVLGIVSFFGTIVRKNRTASTTILLTGIARTAIFLFPALLIVIGRYSKVAPSILWIILTAGLLFLAICLTILSYSRDAKSVHWWWATPLAILRISVYVVLAGAFLLPAVQQWEQTEKRSRVIIVIDVTPSVTTITDEIAQSTTVKPPTRIEKILDFLTDEEIQFMQNILAKNPVYLYRFGTRLDEDTDMLPVGATPWSESDWKAWSSYDFRPFVLRGLSDAAQAAVKTMPAWTPDEVGDSDWALAWSKAKEEDCFPAALLPEDLTTLKANRSKLEKRVDVARSIVLGTAVADSVNDVINREASNMVKGVIVFSDGRSNLGSAAAMNSLQERATKEKIPVFTVAVGEVRENINIAITDLQAPDRTTPDEPVKVTVEADGVGLPGQTVEVRLGLYLPGKNPKEPGAEPDHEMTQELTFEPGEPPHGAVEFVIDPDQLPEVLTEESKKLGRNRQLKQAQEPWSLVARIRRDKREIFSDPDHVSPPRSMLVLDKPLRVLLVTSGPSREYQTLRSLLVREMEQKRAEVCIFVQNEGGSEGSIVQDVPPERLLTRFPDRLDTTNKLSDPAEKFYNLNEFDLVIVFDPDWNRQAKDSTLRINDATIKNLQTWVDNLGGGFIYVAGPIHTYQLARTDEESRLRPLVEILPVVPEDIVVTKTRGIPRTPRRLALKPSPEFDVLKLEEGRQDDPTAGWEQFFTNTDKFVDTGRPGEYVNPYRGIYAYYPVKLVKPGATVLAEFLDVDDKGQADPKPYLVTTQPARGRTAFLASGEIYRLRAAELDYYSRFWIKLCRYISGNREAKASRGKVLMNKEFISGSPIRVQARILAPNAKPYPENGINAKFKIQQLTSSGEATGKIFGPYEMDPRKSGIGFEGYYQGQVSADPRIFPPGDFRYKVIVDVPESPGDVLDSEFILRRSDPELDETRPDFVAMQKIAGSLDMVKARIADPSALQLLLGTSNDANQVKLAYKISEKEKLSLIPQCLDVSTSSQRNRGAIDDLWDNEWMPTESTTAWFQDSYHWLIVTIAALLAMGILLYLGARLLAGLFILIAAASAYLGNPIPLGIVIAIVVTLLAIEWMTRKLLRLA